ncbi:hypothetical protein CBX41_010400, partial [Salmonella enterica]|nr:hypothetical protein [Salmonella enterica]
ETLGRSVTLRELSDLLREEGYPIHYSLISRMEHTVEYLYPYMPELLDSGLGRPQIISLLNMRSDALDVWQKYSVGTEPKNSFDNVFGLTCEQFDDPELYSPGVFRDELIGNLIQALPHPSLNYDRWLIELDPKTQNQRALVGAPEPVPEHLILADHQAWQTVDIQNKEAASWEQTPISAQDNGDVRKFPFRVVTQSRCRQLSPPAGLKSSLIYRVARKCCPVRLCRRMTKQMTRHFYLHIRTVPPQAR